MLPLSRAPVFLLTAFLVLGGLYGITTPLFEAPDEQWHFAFVQHLAQGKGLPEQTVPLPHLARQEASQPPLYYALAAALTFWIDTSDYPANVWENPHYGYDVPGVVNDNKNLFIHTAQENFPYRNTALAMHLARLLSLCMGALAVYFTYSLARILPPLQDFTRHVGGEIVAASIIAFTPQFLFISSAVSNDSTIVAMCVFALFLLARALRVPPTARDAIVLGIVCGLCALAKVSGLAMLPLAMLTLAYIVWKNNAPNFPRLPTCTVVVEFFRLAFLFLLAALGVAGWWYARNVVLYGELTGTARMVEIFGARENPLTFDAWRAQWGEVFETFFVGLGWGNIRAPEWVYLVFGIGVALGIIGLGLGMWRARKHLLRASRDNAARFVLAAWSILIFVALARWMTQTQAPHGRLLFPALPALAVLLAVGWLQLAPPRAKIFIARGAPILLGLFALLVPFTLLAPAYAPPQRLNENDIASIPARVDIRYSDKLMLLGSQVSPHPVDPRGALQVDLYWRVLAPMDTDYSINLAALDENYRVVGARNSYHGHGALPTSLMRAGEIFRDTYWLPARASSGFVQVSVYERRSQENLTAFDPARNEITPLVNRFRFP